MAVQAISYTSFADLESGSSVRTKINGLGQAVAANSTELVAKLSQIDTSISDLESEVTIIQQTISPAAMVSLGANSALVAQALTPDVTEKLTWFDAEIVSFGEDLTYSIPNQNITVALGATAKYRFGGTITFTADVNAVIEAELYVNSIPTGAINSTIGRGSSTSCTIGYYGIRQFSEGDVIDIRVRYVDAGTVGDTDIIIQSSVVVFEKTPY
jgi:hypothetical protein